MGRPCHWKGSEGFGGGCAPPEANIGWSGRHPGSRWRRSAIALLTTGSEPLVKRSQPGGHPEGEMSDSASPQSKRDTVSGCLLRFFWMMIGNIALFFLAILIAQYQAFSILRDGAFWAVVLLLIATRFVDISYMSGETADGNPATRSDWKRYVAVLLGVASAVWLAAHGLAATGWMH
jgi:hypothetical protein